MSFNEPIILCVAWRHIKAIENVFFFVDLKEIFKTKGFAPDEWIVTKFEGSKQKDYNHVL